MTSSSSAFSSPQQLWLARCLPVFVQPTHDVESGHGLVAAFADFDEKSRTCTISHVYQAESSYSRFSELSINKVGSWCYRSWNYYAYGRTADINHLQYQGVDLTLPPPPTTTTTTDQTLSSSTPQHKRPTKPKRPTNPESPTHVLQRGKRLQRQRHMSTRTEPASAPWGSLFTTDFSRDQRWSWGHKRSCLCYGFTRHYNLLAPASEWKMADSVAPSGWDTQVWNSKPVHAYDMRAVATELDAVADGGGDGGDGQRERMQHRPVVYLNTMNHLIGPDDNNPDMDKTWFFEYPVLAGSRSGAESWAQAELPVRSNLLSPCPRNKELDLSAWNGVFAS